MSTTRPDLSVLRPHMRYLLLALMIVVLFAVFSVSADGFFSIHTVMNIGRQAAALALVAIAMSLVMLSGGIDLSVGSSIALSGAVGALCMQAFPADDPLGALIGVLATVATAAGVGLVNGFCAGYLGVAPFIVTLGTMSLARGLTLTLTDSQSIPVDNRIYNWFGQESLFGVPWSLLMVVLAFVAAWVVLQKLGFGRRLYALGDNPEAARASGVNVRWHTMWVYVVAGALVGLAALVVTGRALSAQAQAGIGMEFNAITAVVLGGVSLFGGQGKLKGAALGVVLTSVMFTGLGMLDVKPAINYIVKGLLIVLAVMSDSGLLSNLRRPGRDSQRAARVGSVVPADATVLTLEGISKTFPGVRALEDVSLEIRRGEIHALCGENGAGKSTLMKILSGVYQKDAGEIRVDGQPVSIQSPVDAQNLGIAVIYQESANIPELSVVQNVSLGHEPLGRSRLFLDRRAMWRKTKELMARFGLDIDLGAKVASLTVGKQQMVEIAKALGANAWVVVMDEPTSAISEADKDILFRMIGELKAQNIAVVYISHRMSEIFEIADTVTILRDGKHVITGSINEFDEASIVKHMVGRELSKVFNREPPAQLGDVVLEVRDLTRHGVFEPISFSVRAGEVLAFGGLVGAGRTEVMRCIFGLDKPDGGEVWLGGQRLTIRNPGDAIAAGIGLVTEDRRREGILPHMAVRENITLAGLSRVVRHGLLDRRREEAIAGDFVRTLSIRTPSVEQAIMNLSGGNQQKVCLAKWLNVDPKVVILDEPTRGIDVGAKAEIHQLISRLTDQGVAVIMISSEMSEILGGSDRIIVLHEGEVAREFTDRAEFSQEALIRSASGL